MRARSGWEVGLGLAALLAGLALGAVALLASLGKESAPRQFLPMGLGVTSSLVPVVVNFGDAASARVDVVLDRTRVEVGSVRLRATFAPLDATSRPVERHDAGDLTTLSYAFTLRCLRPRCLPGQYRVKRELELPPAAVTFRTRRRAVDAFGTPLENLGTSREVRWPLVAVVSRISARELARARRANPLRIDDLSTSGLTLGHIAGSWKESSATPPEPSYRLSPNVLAAGLFGLAALLAAGALALVATQVRLRGGVPRAAIDLTSPLMRAVGALDHALLNGHVTARRRALELVSRVLSEHGEDGLAERARRLAWAEATPKEEARSLASDVRDLEGSDDGDAA